MLKKSKLYLQLVEKPSVFFLQTNLENSNQNLEMAEHFYIVFAHVMIITFFFVKKQ